jgi:hypothetical protein
MKYAQPVKLPDGRYFLKISNDSGEKFFHQVNSVVFSAGEQNQVNLKIPENVSLFSDVDEQIVSQAKESKVSWFGKEVSDETVVSAYQKSINPDGILEASFATIRGDIVTTAYDSQKNQIDIKSLGENIQVDLWLELTGLVFSKRSFEPIWKVIQVRTKGSPKFPREYMFSDESPDDPMDLL